MSDAVDCGFKQGGLGDLVAVYETTLNGRGWGMVRNSAFYLPTCILFATCTTTRHSHRSFFNFPAVARMESPHEHQQNLLLSRIVTNIERLNEAVIVMNRSLQAVNIQNMNVELVAQMFKNYQSNVLFHLEATDRLRDPL